MSKCNNCTKVNCSLTACRYNSACCANPVNTNTYCTLEQIDLKIDEETGVIDCSQYDYDYEKAYECIECQLEKYGEIEIEPDITFIEVEDIDDLLR